MSTKIQINSLEALERLIGNDNELEIQLRNAVVQEFTTKHLKAVANEELLKNASKAIIEEIKLEFFEISNKGTYNEKVYLKDKFKEEFRDEVKRAYRQSMTEFVYEELGEQNTKEKVKTALEDATANILNQLAPEVLERRIENLVNQRLKERLGIK